MSSLLNPAFWKKRKRKINRHSCDKIDIYRCNKYQIWATNNDNVYIYEAMYGHVQLGAFFDAEEARESCFMHHKESRHVNFDKKV